MLGSLPEQVLRALEEFLNRLGSLETLAEGEEIGTGSVDELRILDVGIATREEVIDDHVAGPKELSRDK